MEGVVSFGTTDYVMMAIMLSISLAVGAFFAYTGRRKRTQEEYLLGGRQLGVVPVCLSLFATFNSAVSLLGIPADVYSYGTMIFYVPLSIALANLACMWTLLPLVYPLKVTSIYEYLQMRFDSKGIRLLGAGMGMFSNVAYMTIALLSPALALQTAAGLPLWISLMAVGGIGTIYTAIGGIKSVVWTDAFQSLIMFSGVIATLIKGSIEVGGFPAVWTKTGKSGRLIFDEVDFDPRVRHTIWGIFIGSTFYWISVNFSQSFSQRLCSTKSQRDAKMVISFVAPINFIYGAIVVFLGMTMVVYFDFIGCDPMAAGYIKNPNQLMPYFVIRTLGFIPGLSGLYLSTIFSGALSTLSSGINSLAANTVEDILKPFLRHSRESTVTAISKLIVALYGCGIIGLAYVVKEVRGPITQIMYTALGATGGPVFGLFLLGGAFPQANKVGASVGCLVGLAFSLWLNLSKMFYGTRPPALHPVSTDRCEDGVGVTGFGMIGNDTTTFTIWGQGPSSNVTLPFGNNVLNESLEMIQRTESTSIISASDMADLTTLIPVTSNHTSAPSNFHLHDLSYVWLPLIGTLVSVVSGLVVSFVYELMSRNRSRPKPEYLFPCIRKLCSHSDESVSDEDRQMEVAFIEGVNNNKGEISL